MKTISIGSVPGTIQQIAVENDGATIAQIAAQAGLDTTGFEVRVNGGSAVDVNSIPEDGSRILLLKKVKGAAVTASVGCVPGTIQQVALEDGATILDGIAAAGLDAAGFEVRVNNAVVTNLGATLVEGSRVLLLKKVKGAAVTASVGCVPGTIQQVALEDGATIADAIAAAGLDAAGFEVRVNNTVSTNLGAAVVEGSRVLLLKKVKGASIFERIVCAIAKLIKG